MNAPICKYWVRGYPKHELPRAKPKIALVLPPLNLKASPFSLLCCGDCSGHRPQPGWSAMPKHSLGQGATTCPGSGLGKDGEKQIELINTPCFP